MHYRLIWCGSMGTVLLHNKLLSKSVLIKYHPVLQKTVSVVHVCVVYIQCCIGTGLCTTPCCHLLLCWTTPHVEAGHNHSHEGFRAP